MHGETEQQHPEGDWRDDLELTEQRGCLDGVLGECKALRHCRTHDIGLITGAEGAGRGAGGMQGTGSSLQMKSKLASDL
eukprot:3592726-Rhodomonas_salina.2